MTTPSGEQYEIRHGRQVVVVTEVGATLRAYHVGERPVLDGFGPEEVADGGRGQLLIPWPNRIRAGRYRWRGRVHQLDLTEPATGGAIHGLTRWVPWRLVEHGDDRVRLRFVLHAGPGWPFVLACEVAYTLGPGGLVVRTSATNRGLQACPYGTGAHPYLHPGALAVDDAELVVPARARLLVDRAGIPVGRADVAGTAEDLRRPRRLGARRLDTTYTGLERDAAGRVHVALRPPNGPGVTLWADEAYGYVQVYTGDTLGDAARRRRGVAVEPMTCAPDAFNSGDGLVALGPGERHSATWGLAPEALSRGR